MPSGARKNPVLAKSKSTLADVRREVLASDPTALKANTALGGTTLQHRGKFTNIMSEAQVPSSSTAAPSTEAPTPVPQRVPALIPLVSRDYNALKKAATLPIVNSAIHFKRLSSAIKAKAAGLNISTDDYIRQSHTYAQEDKEMRHPSELKAEATTLAYWNAVASATGYTNAEDQWHKDVVDQLAKLYLNMRVDVATTVISAEEIEADPVVADPKGKGKAVDVDPGTPTATVAAKTIKAGTVTYWVTHLVNAITRYCHDGNGKKAGLELLANGGLYARLTEEAESIIDKHDFDRFRDPTQAWGPAIGRILIEERMLNSDGTDAIVCFQTILLIVFCVFAGWRPGSIFCPYKQWVEKGRFLKIKHLRIYRKNGAGEWSLDVDIKNWKGHAGGDRGKSETFSFDPPQRSQYVIFDVAMWTIIYLFMRGCFGDMTLEEILTSEATELNVLDEFLDQPLFCAIAAGGKHIRPEHAALSSQGNGVLRRLAKNAGIPTLRGGMYAFRRDLGDDFNLKIGASLASGVMGHRGKDDRVLNTNYAQSVAHLPLTALRMGDLDETFDELTQAKLTKKAFKNAAIKALLGRAYLDLDNDGMRRPTQMRGGGVRTLSAAPLNAEETASIKAVVDAQMAQIRTLWQELRSYFSDSTMPTSPPQRKSNQPNESFFEKYDVINRDAAEEVMLRIAAAYKSLTDEKRAVTRKATRAAEQRLIDTVSKHASLADSTPARRDVDAQLSTPSFLLRNVVESSSSRAQPSADLPIQSIPTLVASDTRLNAETIALARRTLPQQPDKDAPLPEWRRYESAVAPILAARVHVEALQPPSDVDTALSYKHVHPEVLKFYRRNLAPLEVPRAAVVRSPSPPDEPAADEEYEYSPPVMLDDSNEPDVIGIPTKELRVALMRNLLAPAREMQKNQKQRKINGQWHCQECNHTGPSASALHKHETDVHHPWKVLMQTVVPLKQSGSGNRYHCPLPDCNYSTKWLRNLEQVKRHFISDECIDGDKNRAILEDYLVNMDEIKDKKHVKQTDQLRALLAPLPPPATPKKRGRPPKMPKVRMPSPVLSDHSVASHHDRDDVADMAAMLEQLDIEAVKDAARMHDIPISEQEEFELTALLELLRNAQSLAARGEIPALDEDGRTKLDALLVQGLPAMFDDLFDMMSAHAPTQL